MRLPALLLTLSLCRRYDSASPYVTLGPLLHGRWGTPRSEETRSAASVAARHWLPVTSEHNNQVCLVMNAFYTKYISTTGYDELPASATRKATA